MYLSNDLVTSVKGRINIPLSQNTFQSTDFYRLADEEIKAKLIPLIMKGMEEYYVRVLDVTIPAGTTAFTIPTRAIAGRLRDVQIVSSTDPSFRMPLDRLSPEDISIANSCGGFRKSGFYLQGNQVILYNVLTSSNQLLRLSYFIRPSTLIDVTSAALISAVNYSNNTVTVAALPSNISASTTIDFVRANPGFDCQAIDQIPTNLAGNVFTFASLPNELSVGDYICPATQSCVVQIPPELQPLLFQYVSCRILAAQGDMAYLKVALGELGALESAANALISPRVEGKAKKVTSGRNIGRYV